MTPPDVAALLAETTWLRTLAVNLVGAADADDLTQDTLHRALRCPPAGPHGVRAFLATVARHLALDGVRASRARMVRERVAARGERLPSVVEAVIAVELQRELMALVLELDEPQRDCVLLRFFSDLPPREIARRLQVPVATVHTRLARAVHRLRERLDRRHGRAAWCTALAPAVWRTIPPHLVLGVSVMHVGSKVACALGIALAGALWFTSAGGDAPRPAEGASTQRTVLPASAAVAAPGGEGGGDARRTRLPDAAAPTTPPAAPADPMPLRGRVVDVTGRPQVGIRLGWPQRIDVAGESDASGEFEFVRLPGAPTIVARDPRVSTVLAGDAMVRADNLAVVVVAPRLDFAGRVRSPAGDAIAGAEVLVHMPPHLGADLGAPLDFSVPRRFRAVAGPDGGFEMSDVPSVGGATLVATAGGFLPELRPLPSGPDHALDLVLARPGPGATQVRGVVVDPFGARVQGARVSAGGAVAITGPEGEFALDTSSKHLLPRLCAVAPGFAPAVCTAELVDGAPRWPERVVLQFAGPPATIAGRVVDDHGAALPGIRVWIGDPLYLGVDQQDVLLAETMLGREDRPFWAFVTTNENGRFELRGLARRAYELRCLDAATLHQASRTGVLAGAGDVEIVLGTADLLPRLRGRVVARDGTALEGVLVTLQCPALEVQVPGGTRDEWAHRPAVRTDAEGRFTFDRVPRAGVEVFAQGDEILFAGRMLQPGDDPEEFVVVADRRMHLQVELSPPLDRADELRVLNATGRPMLLRVMRGLSASTNRSAGFVDGRTEVLSLGEDAKTAVVYRAGAEVARMPVTLRAGLVNTVRF